MAQIRMGRRKGNSKRHSQYLRGMSGNRLVAPARRFQVLPTTTIFPLYVQAQALCVHIVPANPWERHGTFLQSPQAHWGNSQESEAEPKGDSSHREARRSQTRRRYQESPARSRRNKGDDAQIQRAPSTDRSKSLRSSPRDVKADQI